MRRRFLGHSGKKLPRRSHAASGRLDHGQVRELPPANPRTCPRSIRRGFGARARVTHFCRSVLACITDGLPMGRLVLGCILLATASPLHAEVLTVTLEQAVAAARSNTPQVRMAAAGVDQAIAEGRSGKGQLLPLLRAEANVMVWDEPTDVSFASSGAAPDLPPPQTPYEQVLAGLLGGLSSPTRIQDQVTGSVSVSIVQPITPLFTIEQAWEAYDLGVDAARLHERSAVRQAELAAATAFTRLQQMRAMADVARLSVEELDGRIEQLDSLLRQGVVTENDRLKLRVARAAAQEQLIRTDAAVTLSGHVLAVAMGLPVGTRIEPVPVPPGACAAPDGPGEGVDALMDRAIAQRPELAELHRRQRQADLGVDLAWARLAPGLNFVGSYRHVEGQGLADPDALFVGLMLDWSVFDWGHTWYGVDVAQARRQQIVEGAAGLSDGIRLEVQQAWLDLRASAQSMAVVELAVSEAAQSYALEVKRFDAGVATTLDLLSAQTAVTSARARRVAAETRCLDARAALRAATAAPVVGEESSHE